MLKDVSYKDKFKMLAPWMQTIVESVKKDLKNEHLKKDFQFVKKYFSGKNVHKLTTEELAEGYSRALIQEEGAEALGEYISNRWLLKNTEVYSYFEKQLEQIDPDFNALKEIDRNKSQELIEGAVRQFGVQRTYLFSVINSVVFPKDILETLEKRAEKEAQQEKTQVEVAQEQLSLAMIHQSYEQQIARLTDKYEKKLQGLQKKYIVDVDGLKKQVSTLQRKLHGQ